MPYLELPGVNLWYNDTGGGTETPVIFMHAASGTCESWVLLTIYPLPRAPNSFGTFGQFCISHRGMNKGKHVGRPRKKVIGDRGQVKPSLNLP